VGLCRRSRRSVHADVLASGYHRLGGRIRSSESIEGVRGRGALPFPARRSRQNKRCSSHTVVVAVRQDHTLETTPTPPSQYHRVGTDLGTHPLGGERKGKPAISTQTCPQARPAYLFVHPWVQNKTARGSHLGPGFSPFLHHQLPAGYRLHLNERNALGPPHAPSASQSRHPIPPHPTVYPRLGGGFSSRVLGFIPSSIFEQSSPALPRGRLTFSRTAKRKGTTHTTIYFCFGPGPTERPSSDHYWEFVFVSGEGTSHPHRQAGYKSTAIASSKGSNQALVYFVFFSR
jgi:hypothetical protein